MSLIYIVYMNYLPLYDGAFNRRIDVANEFILLLITYQLMASANYRVWVSPISKWIGISMVINIMLLLIFNTVLMVWSTIISLKRRFKLAKLK